MSLLYFDEWRETRATIRYIAQIMDIKEENDIDSLFRKGGTTMLQNDIKGLDDFELIAFVVIV